MFNPRGLGNVIGAAGDAASFAAPLLPTFTGSSFADPFGYEQQDSFSAYSTPTSQTWGNSMFDMPGADGRVSFRGFDASPSRSFEDLLQLGPGAQDFEDYLSGNGMSKGDQFSSLGGEWAKIDRWNGAIQKAQQEAYQKTGVMVPGNVIKAIMKIESQGEHLAANPWGYVGLMQVGPGSWGVGTDWDLGRATSDPEYNIFAGTMELARRYTDAKSKNPAYDWGNVALGYFSGSYTSTGAVDGFGTSTDQYYDIFMQNLNALGGATGAMNYGKATGFGQDLTGTSGNGFFNMWGPSARLPVWGEFNQPSSNGLYGYGTSYGLNGTNHTGIDVMADVGTAQYAPMSGVVTCAATGNGPGVDGAGCGAFGYLPNFEGAPQRSGAGRIELLLDNGAVLIFGHSLDSYVQPGQRVNAGDLIGTVGGMNSAHTHLEARVRDPSMPSGWRIVDPREVVGGGNFTQNGNVMGNLAQTQGLSAQSMMPYIGRTNAQPTWGTGYGGGFGGRQGGTGMMGRVRW